MKDLGMSSTENPHYLASNKARRSFSSEQKVEIIWKSLLFLSVRADLLLAFDDYFNFSPVFNDGLSSFFFLTLTEMEVGSGKILNSRSFKPTQNHADPLWFFSQIIWMSMCSGPVHWKAENVGLIMVHSIKHFNHKVLSQIKFEWSAMNWKFRKFLFCYQILLLKPHSFPAGLFE